jgi:putative DNA primase/helicase
LAGHGWPDRARKAAVALAKVKSEIDESRGVQLLGDIREVFEDKGAGRIFSGDLVNELNAIEGSGWGGWHEGAGMRKDDLARELGRYPISAQKLRIGDHTRWGYNQSQFEDAWSRYLPRRDG